MISPKIFSTCCSRQYWSVNYKKNTNSRLYIGSLFDDETKDIFNSDEERRRKFRLRGGGILNGLSIPSTQPIPMGYQPPTPFIYYGSQQAQYAPNMSYPCQPLMICSVPGPCNVPPGFVTLAQTPGISGVSSPGIPIVPQPVPQEQPTVGKLSSKTCATLETMPKQVQKFTLPAVKSGEPTTSGALHKSSECLRTSFEDEMSGELSENALTNQQKLVVDILSSFVQRKKNIVLHLLTANALKKKLQGEHPVETMEELTRSYYKHKAHALKHIRQ